jgi:hypothetical protein
VRRFQLGLRTGRLTPAWAMGFNKREMEDHRRRAAEKEAAARRRAHFCCDAPHSLHCQMRLLIA